MRSDLVYYLLQLLDREGTVLIPGVGRVSLVVEGAHLNREGDMLLPPFGTAGFDDEVEGKGNALSRYIAYRLGISQDDARALVNNFGKAIRDEIANRGECRVERLGRFSTSEGRIHFIPDADAFNARYRGYVPVRLAEIQRKTTETPVEAKHDEGPAAIIATTPDVADATADSAKRTVATAATTGMPQNVTSGPSKPAEESSEITAPQRRKPSRVLWIIPLAVVAIFLAAGVAYMQYKARSAMMYPAEVYNRAPVVDSSRLPDSLDRGASSNQAPPAREEGVYEEKPGKASESNATTGSLPDSASQDIAATGGDSWEPAPAPEAPGVSADCAVIVGAFGVPDNAERMKKRLLEMGLEPVSSPRGSLTQVGAAAPCGSAEIDSILEVLRREVEAEAWIYSPG